MVPPGWFWLVLVISTEIFCSAGQLIFPENVSRTPRKNTNTITDIDATCARDSMDITVRMEKPFKGVIFTKDFSRECRAQGNLDNSVSLHLPPNACGVRVSSLSTNTTVNDIDDGSFEGLFYVVTVVIQMDRFLQQSSDQERVVKCWLKPKAMQIKSYIIEEMVEKKLKEITKSQPKDKHNSRSGRMGSEWKDISEEQQVAIMERARAWMEILPSNGNMEATTVEVGEPTMLVIKSTLPAGIGLRITDCLAHDGLGESSQTLLDERGCPVDELIFPKMRMYFQKSTSEHKTKNVNSRKIDTVNSEETIQNKDEDQSNMFKNIMSYQHASTIFSAFKFPDRARLHLTCGLELCKGSCPRVDCKESEMLPKSKDALSRRVRLDKDADGTIIDRLQVYNSIEVLAPNIELEDDASIRGSRRTNGFNGGDLDNFLTSIPGDKTVCMSPSKMALSFCVLGLVFLSALVVAFISLIRARRKYGADRCGGPLSFYAGSKSIFSGSGSSNSGFSGSKLLLTDSPYLDHQSTSSNWPYGRVL